MKKLLFLGVAMMLSLNLSAAKHKAETPLTPDTTPRIIEIATENTAILLTVTPTGELEFAYYGNRIAKPVFWGDKQEFSGEYLLNEGINLSLRKVFESSVHVIEEVK